MLSLCVCVKLLYVKLLYVKFLCVAGGGRREEAEEEEKPGIQNQKQEPHTKMWGIIPKKNRITIRPNIEWCIMVYPQLQANSEVSRKQFAAQFCFFLNGWGMLEYPLVN